GLRVVVSAVQANGGIPAELSFRHPSAPKLRRSSHFKSLPRGTHGQAIKKQPIVPSMKANRRSYRGPSMNIIHMNEFERARKGFSSQEAVGLLRECRELTIRRLTASLVRMMGKVDDAL